ncbi:hypothetical protein OG948_33135 [Embleya sp. NBC_00888]|nr:hypothetical protein OG948_33135 [Embleya sp. NBC_00888]
MGASDGGTRRHFLAAPSITMSGPPVSKTAWDGTEWGGRGGGGVLRPGGCGVLRRGGRG